MYNMLKILFYSCQEIGKFILPKAMNFSEPRKGEEAKEVLLNEERSLNEM